VKQNETKVTKNKVFKQKKKKKKKKLDNYSTTQRGGFIYLHDVAYSLIRDTRPDWIEQNPNFAINPKITCGALCLSLRVKLAIRERWCGFSARIAERI
jgi:hypothetical protein